MSVVDQEDDDAAVSEAAVEVREENMFGCVRHIFSRAGHTPCAALNVMITFLQKCAVVPRRARIQGA